MDAVHASVSWTASEWFLLARIENATYTLVTSNYYFALVDFTLVIGPRKREKVSEVERNAVIRTVLRMDVVRSRLWVR